jgi:hypothetical protein
MPATAETPSDLIEAPRPGNDVAAVANDEGFTTIELLMWAAVMVVAIVAIGALLRVLGVDVINWVRTQLGV